MKKIAIKFPIIYKNLTARRSANANRR